MSTTPQTSLTEYYNKHEDKGRHTPARSTAATTGEEEGGTAVLTRVLDLARPAVCALGPLVGHLEVNCNSCCRGLAVLPHGGTRLSHTRGHHNSGGDVQQAGSGFAASPCAVPPYVEVTGTTVCAFCFPPTARVIAHAQLPSWCMWKGTHQATSESRLCWGGTAVGGRIAGHVQFFKAVDRSQLSAR